MAVIKARTEFASALNQVCAEKGIDINSAIESIKQAIIAAYRKDYGEKPDFEYIVDLDPITGQARIFEYPEGEDPEKTKKEITPKAKSEKEKFGRIAAMTARQVIKQRFREAEKDAILDEYSERIGGLVSGLVLRFDGSLVIVDIGKTEAIMPPQEQNRRETYEVSRRFTFLIKEINDSQRGREIIVSRADPGLVLALFKREVPEVSSGAVEIKAIAREAGNRTKLAVISTQIGVDPVGSCVGQKGVRVQAVIDELDGEKIDIIQFSEDKEKFIASALAPAENVKVKINEKQAEVEVFVAEDQLSLAIGKEGQNVRLAAKLTGFRIDIKDIDGKTPKVREKKDVEDEEEISKKKKAVKTVKKAKKEESKKEKKSPKKVKKEKSKA
ncbi:MAG: transcription termination factor NusA [Patescibacteria group bacterium]